MTSSDNRAVLDDLAERIDALSTRRVRVAIDGLTAAGKTSFGHQLAERIGLAGRPVLRACLDDFKRPWRDRHLYDRASAEGYYRNAYDYAAAVDLLLEPGGPDGSGACALCNIDPVTQIDHSSVQVHAATDAVLIVDGVFAFRPEINDYWEFRIWLDVNPETSVSRGVRRDRQWADTEAETLHRTRYLPAEQLYLAEVDPVPIADVVIDNTVFDKPVILRT
ncbi:hypothetical protein HQ32_01048 [Prauserella sp. Am3]|nr:hypothetical protein HQ32_01048 [Prauserella sp. Am3]